jgi:radical SAM superfamily enzyme YgiQ (UPF0313 family)
MNQLTNVLKSDNRSGPIILVSAPMGANFPFSFGYLAAYLKQQNENFILLFRDMPEEQLVQKIISLKPLMVGFGNLYPELPIFKRYIELLNSAGRTFPIVIGGQMVSPTPEFSVNLTGADIGVIGEGEITLFKLAQALRQGMDISSIKGLVIRQGSRTVLTGAGEFIENLDDLPKVPFEMFPSNWLETGHWYAAYAPRMLLRYNDRVIPVHGGRGCPYRCNFCYHHSKFRMRSVPAMLAEAEENLERFNGNVLNFSDDLAMVNPKRVRDLVEHISKLKKPVEYYMLGHFEVIAKLEDDLLKALKETGCRMIGQGFESGSDRILKLIGKRSDSNMILAQVERLNRYGIYSTGNFMIGEISETREDVAETRRVMKECVRIAPNTELTFSIATPFPGSPLYNEVFRRGMMKDDYEFYERYRSMEGVYDWKVVANMSEMSDREIIDLYRQLVQEYENEKRKYLGGAMSVICRGQIIAGQIHYRFFKERLKFLNLAPYRFAYNSFQRSMDRAKWKIRANH